MDKTQLRKFIDRYSMGQKVETALWEVGDGYIRTSVVNGNRTFVGHVRMDGVEFAEQCEIGVYTPQFVKLLNVLDGRVNERLLKVGDKPVAIALDDGNVFVRCGLRDRSTIPAVPPLKQEPPYDVEFKLTPELVATFVKATLALPDEPNFTVRPTATNAEILIGHSGTSNTNTVKFAVETTKTSAAKAMTFVSEFFVDALKFNSDIMAKPNAVATAHFSKEGLAKLTFSDLTTVATYYFIGI
jgi:hypothetical protein